MARDAQNIWRWERVIWWMIGAILCLKFPEKFCIVMMEFLHTKSYAMEIRWFLRWDCPNASVSSEVPVASDYTCRAGLAYIYRYRTCIIICFFPQTALSAERDASPRRVVYSCFTWCPLRPSLSTRFTPDSPVACRSVRHVASTRVLCRSFCIWSLLVGAKLF